MAAQTSDDAFHEIQLNGKQLVFLFMAATVVSVVIFLCGVLVGRGVRVERGGTAADAAIGAAPDAPAPQATTPTPTGSDPRAAAPPQAADDQLSYFNRLEKTDPPAEELKPAPEKGAAPAPAAAARAAAPVAPPVQAAPVPAPTQPQVQAPKQVPTQAPVQAPVQAKAAPVEKAPTPVQAPAASGGAGYAVQVAALNVRGEADAIAKRLSAKGYAAYVLDPAHGTPQVYRVRVGTFGSRHEADTVAARLQKEEQFKPWVTR